VTVTDLVTRMPLRLVADPGRVLARLFVPGHEQLNEQSRATGVLARILALPDAAVSPAVERLIQRYADRHRDLEGLLLRHASLLDHRIPDGSQIGPKRRLLLGAYFTQEVAIEGAALFNPSVVLHPDQADLGEDEVRFVVSLRAVGEGHISCVEFRTGVWGTGADLRLDPAGRVVEAGTVGPAAQQRHQFGALLGASGADAESSRYLLSRLPPEFIQEDLDRAVIALRGQRLTRHGAEHTADLARYIAQDSYGLTFEADSTIAERVLYPVAPSESHGIEDARFVRFLDDGTAEYRATYSAYDGQRIKTHTVTTADFQQFTFTPLAGPGAGNKGMALFPRKVSGRQVALSRWDRESCSITYSDDGLWWDDAVTVHVPRSAWEVIQTGNSGAPVETDAGWLVLTHGVGPMREYALGALLLDLDDPTRVLGSLEEPLLVPNEDERTGYVPNVVYSCGVLRHQDRMLLPYGASDASVRFATVDLLGLIERLLATSANSSA